MSKFFIHVEEINEDGTRTPFALSGGEVTANGFVLFRIGEVKDGEVCGYVDTQEMKIGEIAAFLRTTPDLKNAAILAAVARDDEYCDCGEMEE